MNDETNNRLRVEEMLSLTGRTAVVTGAAMGIGRSIAHHLAAAGAAVVLADVDGDAVELAAKALGRNDHEVLPVQADVSAEADVDRMLEATLDWRGGIDILVNNAGIFPTVPVLEMTLADFNHVIAVNLNGVFLTCRIFGRQLVAQGRGGRIINVTSIDALHPSSVGLAHYDASKHGVWGFTKNLALELAPHDIWVNAIAPGGVSTPGTSHLQSSAGADTSDLVARFSARIPMRRMADPDEIGSVALFLASDMASYMTGSQVVVDGGVLLT
ncbi:MAG TPA: SDR family NAD(P)-dependent oxidoreductase [Nocardioides sp.]|uniref:SDR family NAD(P)-dependent oxidoreductase n=1 Tax=Nocardioides sp. TaxID=35761 RepID=UPI002C1ED981|nr:SDR family NAD(P)-dependent oxidoreductase [Nocardioides sp.]HTW13878.1 SDR family NAD(P)-dependent oxidoreductase [Nocardioides sp.]